MSHPRIPRSGNKMRKRKARMPAPSPPPALAMSESIEHGRLIAATDMIVASRRISQKRGVRSMRSERNDTSREMAKI
jgi:hypothetical protein